MRSFGRRCAWCGCLLSGVKDGRDLPASAKRVSRVFGGYICHSCLRRGILRWVVREASHIGVTGQSST